jgi:hypothetical protein
VVDYKPLVYGTLTILLIIFGIFIISEFLLPAEYQVGELLGTFGENFFSIFGNEEDEKDRFEEHFENVFVKEYNSCLDSNNKECWCLGEELDIVNKFSVQVEQVSQKIKFTLLDKNGGSFAEHPFEFIGEGCVIVEQTSFLLDALVGNKVLINSGKTSYISFELESLEDILGTKTNYKNEVNIDSMFYKVDSGKICILDKANSELFKDKPRCNQNA